MTRVAIAWQVAERGLDAAKQEAERLTAAHGAAMQAMQDQVITRHGGAAAELGLGAPAPLRLHKRPQGMADLCLLKSMQGST